MATSNDDFKLCSDRTKQRRINSMVSIILTELCTKNENCASISMLDRTVDDVSFSKSRKKFVQNANVHEKQNEPITIFDRLNSQSEFSEKFSDSIDNKSGVDFDYSRDDWKTDEIEKK